MDKRKLIGTIIGVTMFAALIVGATYAWFTFTLNVSNGNYSGTTRNFLINYTKGTEIEDVPMLASGTASTASSLMVSAQKADTTMTGNFYIKLNTTSSNTLTTSGALNYAVCSGTASAAACTGALTTGSTGVLDAGTVTASGDKTIYTQAISSSTTDLNTLTYYWIFFWLDGNVVTNSHLGQSYSGYIHASATQS